jgi:hypothetical protein
MEDGERLKQFLIALGGVSEVSRCLGHKHHTTVTDWVKRGRIPHWWFERIQKVAGAKGVKLPSWLLKDMKARGLEV